MLRGIGILIAALLLDGDGGGGNDDEAGALKKLGDLMDTRIDAAFERWLERKPGGDPPAADPPKPAAGDPPSDPPKPAAEPIKAPGFFELLFGSPARSDK
jgi:hypothetical protein